MASADAVSYTHLYFYRGTDAYLHAAGLVGEKDSPSSVTLDSAVITVTGTVDGRSDQNMLYLNTPQGVMELKLDTCLLYTSRCV